MPPIPTLSLTAAYAFGTLKGLEKEITDIRNLVIEWDSSYTSSLRRGFVVDLFERKGIYNEFLEKHWPDGLSPAGQANRKRFLRIKQDYEDFLVGRGPESESEKGELNNSEQAIEFALESHLRDFLAKNLGKIEPGLHLYQFGDRVGIEYAVNGGRIDLLAIDSAGRLVVIELKLSSGRNKALGQLLYYMAWIDKNLQKGSCRGLIIASDISEELILAVSRAPGVSLARYQMTFAIEKIE